MINKWPKYTYLSRIVILLLQSAIKRGVGVPLFRYVVLFVRVLVFAFYFTVRATSLGFLLKLLDVRRLSSLSGRWISWRILRCLSSQEGPLDLSFIGTNIGARFGRPGTAPRHLPLTILDLLAVSFNTQFPLLSRAWLPVVPVALP